MERDDLEAKHLKKSISVTALKDNQEIYTGIKDYETFKILFDSFGSSAEKLISCDSDTNPKLRKDVDLKDHCQQSKRFLLCGLQCGLLEKGIAYRAGISVSHFSRICITWIDFLHSNFRALPIWATRETVDKTMPKSFKETSKDLCHFRCY